MTATLRLFQAEIEPIKPKKVNKPKELILTFARVWSTHYMGEMYEFAGQDFRRAKEYLDLHDGEFDAENIQQRADVYLQMEGFYAEHRHTFSIFMNNIGSFVPKPSMKQKVDWTQGKKKTCPKCGLEYRAKEGHDCYLTGTKIQPERD